MAENKLLASKEDFEKYTGIQEEENYSQAELFLGSASDIVRNYLGYDPSKHNSKKLFNGNGRKWLRLESKPIQSINEVQIEGMTVDKQFFYFDDDTLIFKNETFPEGIKNIYVDFDSGFEEVPDLIKLTVLRIASLLATESDQNISVVSKTFDGSTRTFYNFTNFQKYLLPISKWKLV